MNNWWDGFETKFREMSAANRSINHSQPFTKSERLDRTLTTQKMGEEPHEHPTHRKSTRQLSIPAGD